LLHNAVKVYPPLCALAPPAVIIRPAAAPIIRTDFIATLEFMMDMVSFPWMANRQPEAT